MAMVQSCTSEFIAMQTSLDKANFKARSFMQEVLDNSSSVGRVTVPGLGESPEKGTTLEEENQIE